jgi:hypothetical protein
MNSNYSKPVNLGNPDEYKVAQLASIVRELIGNFFVLLNSFNDLFFNNLKIQEKKIK